MPWLILLTHSKGNMKCLSHLRAFADASPSTKSILFLSPQHLLTTQLTPTWGCLNKWFISLPDLLIGLGIPLSADIARSPPLYTIINCSLVFSSTRSGGLCGKGLNWAPSAANDIMPNRLDGEKEALTSPHHIGVCSPVTLQTAVPWLSPIYLLFRWKYYICFSRRS